MKTQKEEEIQESTWFMWQSLSFFRVFLPLWICQNRLCSATGTTDPQISEAPHTCIHTFITSLHMYRGQWSTISSHVHHLEHTTSGAEKRETRESHGVFMSPLGRDTCDTTHASLARMSHWELEKQLFDEYYCQCHILDSNAVSFFLPLVRFLSYSFVQKLNVIGPSPEWDLKKAFSVWFLCLVCLWLLTPLQSVPSGISQICVSPVPFPLSIINSGWFSAFVHAFISLFIHYLLSFFYVSLLDFKEILKSKTQYLPSRSPHFKDSGQDFID